jgi:hypothetical protein
MSNRLLLGMGQREMGALAAESRGKLCGLAVELQNWTLAGQPKDLNVVPCNAVAQAGANGFHSSFFGGKAGRQTLCGVRLAHTVPDLGGSEHPTQKTVAKALYGGLNPVYLTDVNSSPYNHLGLYAKVSYRWLCVSKPKLI